MTPIAAPVTPSMVPNYFDFPEDLIKRDQWVCWGRGGTDREKKIPINPKTGRNAKSNDPSTWGSFDTAVEFAEKHNLGLGFMFSENDDFVGIDFDEYRNPQTGVTDPRMVAIIEKLNSYTEISPSGYGYHVIVKGFVPGSLNRRDPHATPLRKNKQPGIEIYSDRRYFTMTGNIVEGF